MACRIAVSRCCSISRCGGPARRAQLGLCLRERELERAPLLQPLAGLVGQRRLELARAIGVGLLRLHRFRLPASCHAPPMVHARPTFGQTELAPAEAEPLPLTRSADTTLEPAAGAAGREHALAPDPWIAFSRIFATPRACCCARPSSRSSSSSRSPSGSAPTPRCSRSSTSCSSRPLPFRDARSHRRSQRGREARSQPRRHRGAQLPRLASAGPVVRRDERVRGTQHERGERRRRARAAARAPSRPRRSSMSWASGRSSAARSCRRRPSPGRRTRSFSATGSGSGASVGRRR